MPSTVTFPTLLLFLLLTPGAAAWAQEEVVQLDGIAAVVNQEIVLESEIRHHLRVMRERMLREGVRPPAAEHLRRQTLELLIRRRLQLQQAAQSNIKVTDELLQRSLRNLADQHNISVEDFEQILEQDGYNFDRFLQDMNDELTIKKLRQEQVENRISISNQEIERYLKRQNVQGDEVEYHVGHILLSLEDPNDEEAHATKQRLAEELSERLRNGEDFHQVASTYSDARSSEEGGDLGWRPAKELPSLLAPLVMTMQEGESSDPITSPGGFHIIQLHAIRSGGKPLMVRQTRARQILIIPKNEEEAAAAHEQLGNLKNRIEAGADFSELARIHSQDLSSVPRGGDLGWVSEGTLPPGMERSLDALEPGELGDPFQSVLGWHLAEVLERRVVDNLEESRRAEARKHIRARKIEEATEEWLNLLKNEAYIEYRQPPENSDSTQSASSG